MNTNKALYWIALGAIAFGLSSEYQRGGLSSIRSLAEGAGARLSHLATHAHEALYAAAMVTGHWGVSSSKQTLVAKADEVSGIMDLHEAEVERVVAAHEAQIARAQARLVRVQAELQRRNIERLVREQTSRVQMVDSVHRVITVCPKSGHRVRVESDPDMADLDIDVDVPNVEIASRP